MNVIGFSGALDGCRLPQVVPKLSPLFFHDAAAALVQAGTLTFAVEEERLNRQKHTNAFPHLALQACLTHGGLMPCDIDRFAFFFEERFFNRSLTEACARLAHAPPEADVRTLLVERLSVHLGFECDPARLSFVNHHLAHARSAFAGSGYDRALVLVIDGNGEEESTSIFRADGASLSRLVDHPISKSLGHFYRKATKLVGFNDFDEYKFMGLAPYGDSTRFQDAIDGLMRPEPDGAYTLDIAGLEAFADSAGLNRSAITNPRERAADFAAAVQRALERLAIHILAPWAESTGLRNLCLAGGVAQNCVMNSRLAKCGLFDRVFAYPGAYDAGAAIGAALEVGADKPSEVRTGAKFDPFLGPPTPSHVDIPNAFEPWRAFLSWKASDDSALSAAESLAEGAIVGWMNGRSEFGPRALGARSILADARPFENWSRINLAIKQRESFRPFAPVCLQAHADLYFETPHSAETLGHMTFVSTVRDAHRDTLGAVTHVDASARLQTVSLTWNRRLHAVLEHFHARTGCPVVLNTSFNNSAEPIVQTPEDAVRTFLLTGLDVLVIDRWIVTKYANPFDHLHEMAARLNDWAWVERSSGHSRTKTVVRRAPHYAVAIPDRLEDYLATIEGGAWRRLGPVLGKTAQAPVEVSETLVKLWRAAMIDVRHA